MSALASSSGALVTDIRFGDAAGIGIWALAPAKLQADTRLKDIQEPVAAHRLINVPKRASLELMASFRAGLLPLPQ